LPDATRGLAFTPYSASEKYSLPCVRFEGAGAWVVPHAVTVAHISEIPSHLRPVAYAAAPFSNFMCLNAVTDTEQG